jgi:N-acetylglucosamine-6-phosphate deacetylase
MKTIRLANGNIVTDSTVIRRDIVLRDGVISFDDSGVRCDQTIDITGKYVVPGFIDIHFHGYNFFDFTYGIYDAQKKMFDSSKEAYGNGFSMLANLLPSFGVTSYYLATIAAPVERIKAACGHLRHFADSQPIGSKLLGVLLEGTFINPNMCGAQNPAYVYESSLDVFESFDASDVIKMVNLAPECGQKTLEFIRYLTDKNIITAAGHCNATGDQIDAAVEAGLKYFVHFLNGPTGHSFKPFDGGGSVESVLRNESLYVEQIVDGFHIAPSYVREVIGRKGIDKIIGITDALYAAGANIKQFDMGGIMARMSDNCEYFSVLGKPNTLCSSALTMDRAFGNLLNWLTSDMPGVWRRRHEAHSFEEAVVMAAKACSTNPAELMGLNKQGYGKIADGAAADICIVDIKGHGGGYNAAVEKTIVDGNIVYSKN